MLIIQSLVFQELSFFVIFYAIPNFEFGDVHVFQAVNVGHHKVGEIDEPSMYRIKDELVMFCSRNGYCMRELIN